MTIRRSGPGRRENVLSPGHAVRSPRLRGASAPRKRRSEPGTHEVRAHAVSFGWQKSVGCIARLSHREVARPVGARRALARKKSAATPDAGRGWTEGETVRVCGIPKQSSHAWPPGPKLEGSRHDGRRSRAHARLALTGRAKQGPWLAGQLPLLGPRGQRRLGQHVGRIGFRLGCACG